MDQSAKIADQTLPKNHDAEKHFVQRHTWMYWVPAIVGLVIGLVVGGTVMREKSEQNMQDKSSVSTTPPVTRTQEPKLKLFNNTYFSFSYSDDWRLENNRTPANSLAHVYLVRADNPTVPDGSPCQNCMFMSVTYYDATMPVSFAYTNGSEKNETIKTYRTNGLTGIRGQATSTMGLTEHVYLKHPMKGYIQFSLAFPSDKKALAAFEQVLSTFTVHELKPTGVPNIYPTNALNPNPSEVISCTDDAKQCPDGSWVGRAGPKCEFTPCPPAQ